MEKNKNLRIFKILLVIMFFLVIIIIFSSYLFDFFGEVTENQDALKSSSEIYQESMSAVVKILEYSRIARINT